MVKSTSEPLTSVELWLNHWARQDYSWKALDGRQERLNGVTPTDFWRRTSTNQLRTDEELLAAGHLIDCGDRGLFHIVYLPKKWFDELNIQRDYTESLDQAWSEKFQHFHGQIPTIFQGIFLTSESATRLVSMKVVLFDGCCFTNDFIITSVDGEKSFKNSLFLGKLNSKGFGYPTNESTLLAFDTCEFFDEVTFEKGRFDADLSFDSCHFHKQVTISEGEFLRLVRIVSSCFNSKFAISQSKVSRRFTIFDSEFFGSFELCETCFSGETSLNEVSLQGDVAIIGCRFQDRARFADVEWPKIASSTAWAPETFFSDDVSFSGARPPPIQFFDDVRFGGAVSFPRARDSAWLKGFNSELRAVRGGHTEQVAPTEMRQLESGCRTLRKVAASNGDAHLEHQWHRCELVARRNGSDVSVLERSLSHMYGLCADYGLSISRPFLILAILCCSFAIIYAATHTGVTFSGELDWRSLTEGFGYSFNRTLPIGVFEFSENGWRRELLGTAGTWHSIAVRAVATLQTIMSVVLIYLGVMAARRKFKIS